MMSRRPQSVEILELWQIGEFQHSHISTNVKFDGSIEAIYAFCIIVIDNDDVVLYPYTN